MPVRKLKKIPSIHRAHGLFGVITRLSAVSPLPGMFFAGGNVLMCAREIRLPAIVEAVARRYQIDRACPANVEEFAQAGPIEDRPVLQRDFRGYLERGAAGIAIRSEGRIVAYNWVFTDSYDLKFPHGRSVVVRMAPGCVFFGNGYVDPAYRMRGLFPLLVRESAAALGPDRVCWSSTDLWNEMSLSSHGRVGFARMGVVSCITLAGGSRFRFKAEGGRDWVAVRNALHVSADRAELSAPWGKSRADLKNDLVTD